MVKKRIKKKRPRVESCDVSTSAADLGSCEDGREGDQKVDLEPNLATGISKNCGETSVILRSERRCKQRVKPKPLYGAGDMILTVGDGDFSFSVALARKWKGKVFIVATVYDSKKELRRKYGMCAVENARFLEKMGMEVRYDIDCTKLHEVPDFQGCFTKVVFNFPHLGNDDIRDSVFQHRNLFQQFFDSVIVCLDGSTDAPAIHVTLKKGEPYQSWKVQAIAKQSGRLKCESTVPFVPQDFPDYEHRRTKGAAYEDGRGFNSENIVQNASTFVFVLK